MPDSGKRVDPIPDEFASYEEAAEFWDTHDTTDYPDVFQRIEVEDAVLRRRRYEVEVDEDVIRVLREKAQQRDVSVSRLVSDLLRQQLLSASSSPSSSSAS
jgi:hypothetical protein